MPLTDAAVVKAAEIYAELRHRGTPIGDADVLITASALVHGLAVVTNNEDHFRRITGLVVETGSAHRLAPARFSSAREEAGLAV